MPLHPQRQGENPKARAIPEGEPGWGQQPACSPTAAGSARDRPQRSNEPANGRNHEDLDRASASRCDRTPRSGSARPTTPTGRNWRQIGGYRVSYDCGDVTVGNEAHGWQDRCRVSPATPAWPSPTPSSATTSSATCRLKPACSCSFGLVTRFLPLIPP